VGYKCSRGTSYTYDIWTKKRNRYGVEKTVDTHKILVNAIKCYACLQEI
jgi:hypothetical protein